MAIANRPNFKSILDRPSADAEPPPQLPVGSYTCVVKGLPREDVSAKKKTPFVEFELNVIAAGADVDEEELAQFGPVNGKVLKNQYYLTEDSEYRLKEFLDHCGIDREDEEGNKLSHAGRIDLIPGSQVMVFIQHEPSQDGTKFFARIKGTASVEE